MILISKRVIITLKIFQPLIYLFRGTNRDKIVQLICRNVECRNELIAIKVHRACFHPNTE